MLDRKAQEADKRHASSFALQEEMQKKINDMASRDGALQYAV